jgi:hypothetical protein
MFKSLAFAGLLLALLSNQVSAQGPTQAQRDAIRAACRSDFLANCSGVEPGGKEAFECLLRNDAKLSPSCQAAVSAAAPKPAEPAAAAPAAPAGASPANSESAPPAAKVERAPPGIQVAPTEAQNEQLKTAQQACTLNDFVSHCSWIAPGNPEILLCLKANTADLSPNCQAAVQSLPAPTPAATAPPPAEPARQAAPAKKPVEPKPVEPARASAPPAPTPAAPAAAPAKPTAQQTAAIRAACRSDFMSRCSGVQPGGAEALQCLKRNEAQLSAACRSAVAAIDGGGAAGAAAAPSGAPAATAVPAVAPIGPMPMLRPRDALAIVQICGAEVRSLCAGVPFGGGRIISCLAANTSSLSPNCYSALSAAAGR